MSDTQPTGQLISITEVQRLVQERRRHPRAAGRSDLGSMRPARSTSQVRRLMLEHRAAPPFGDDAA